MKKLVMKLILLVISFCSIAISCNKNDDTIVKKIALQNEPPLSFALNLDDDAINIDVLPNLSWQSAKNPSGNEVTYDLYLGENLNPTTLYKGDISSSSFQLTERLNLLTDYYWKVEATDAAGKISQSEIHKFTTRNLNIPKTPLVADGVFAPRYDHSATSFDNKLWLIGGVIDGEGSNNYTNDVWYSEDGLKWTEATPNAEFSKRSFQATVTFNNKLWLIGGLNSELVGDVWSSVDGVTWTEEVAEAPFSYRYYHTATVFNNKIWLIGGNSEGGNALDVWYSENGIDWVMATANISTAKISRPGTVVFKDKLLVFGGSRDSSFNYTNEVWQSEDGVKWNKLAANSSLPPLQGKNLLVFDDRLWLMDNSSISNGQAWYSDDGKEWFLAYPKESFLVRSHYTTTVFNDKIWLIGGVTFPEYYNDVWVLD
jgi:hypothetical protein